jgi:hypothetical protein
MVGNEDGISFPLDAVVKAAYAVNHVDRFMEMLDMARSIQHVLPKEIRKGIEQTDTLREELTSEMLSKLALDFARYPSAIIELMHTMLAEIRSYIGVWVDGEGEEPKMYGMLDANDMKVIEEMITFVQRVGSKSVRQLLQYLESVNDGDHAYLVIEGGRRDCEIRVRYNLTTGTCQELDLRAGAPKTE